MSIKNVRFEVLDSFRGIAAIMVAIYHFNIIGMINSINLIKNSWLFVDFFFVLSGFIISHGYLNRINNMENLKLFIYKRFLRIYPLHFFMLLLFIPYAIGGVLLNFDFGDRFSISAFFQNIFLVQSLGFNNVETWNIPSWSISAEFYTYIFFGLICLIFPILKNKLFLGLIFSFVSFIVLYSYSSMSDTHDLAFFRCTFSFFLGCSGFFIFANVKYTTNNFIELFVLFIFCFYFSFVIDSGSLMAFFSPILFLFIILVFVKEFGFISSLLKIHFFQFLGKLSFSIYLTHTFFITLFKSFLLLLEMKTRNLYLLNLSGVTYIDLGWNYKNDFLYIPYLLIVILFSYITYNYIELFFQKKFKKY